MRQPGHRRRTATGPGSSGRPRADRDPRRARAASAVPCSWLLDEMSGSTRGPRDPGGAVEGVAGPQEPLRADRAPMRCVQGLAISSGTLAFSIRVPTTEYSRAAPGRPNGYRGPGGPGGVRAGRVTPEQNARPCNAGSRIDPTARPAAAPRRPGPRQALAYHDGTAASPPDYPPPLEVSPDRPAPPRAEDRPSTSRRVDTEYWGGTGPLLGVASARGRDPQRASSWPTTPRPARSCGGRRVVRPPRARRRDRGDVPYEDRVSRGS